MMVGNKSSIPQAKKGATAPGQGCGRGGQVPHGKGVHPAAGVSGNALCVIPQKRSIAKADRSC